MELRIERSEYGFKFFVSIPGILKIIEIVCCGISLMCSQIFDAWWTSPVKALIVLNIFLIIGLIYSIIELALHICHVVRQFSSQFLKKYDCISCIILSISLCSSSTSILQYNEKPASLNSAIVFGFFASVAFVVNAIFRVTQFRETI